MIIEIHGGGFKNKGAELMLVSILNVFSEKYPEVKFCINPSVYDDSASCDKYGLFEYIKLPKARGGRLFYPRFLINRFLSKFTTRKYCENRRWVRFSDVDALIDISGVRFSDKAEEIGGRNFIQLARYFRKRGKPVILLPQMFGPFDNIGSLELIQRLEKEASLVFCRDEVSYNYVTKSLPNFEPVYKAPDITISTKPPSDFAVPPHKYGCIVPNVRMFDRGESGWSEIYIERLAMTAKKMHEKGVKPIILVHSVDNTEDQPLADAVIKIVGGGICTIKRAEDPLETKAFISGSQLVVGSRYHSIVSALSSGVPAIVMGWAHKYETILDDFGMSKFIHNVSDDEQQFLELIEYVLDKDNSQSLRDKLYRKKEGMLVDSEFMWNKVFQTLGLPD